MSRDERPTDAGLRQMLLAGEVEESALPAGSKVGRYVVLETLGFGGMSIVYKAYDPRLDRAIALKLVRFDRASPGSADEARARLVREAQALARLSHPNIVAVHDVGTFGDDVFVAMEFVAGPTLTEWCRAPGRTAEEIIEAFRGAGRGLGAAHAAGLVHRDFKPDNVIVGADGRPRVLDFGLARAAGPTEAGTGRGPAPSDGRVTGSGPMVGTPAYMAPEQHRSEAIDERTDQFSFCVALWEAVHRQSPFPGASVEEIALAVTEGRLSTPPVDARAPGWLRPVLLKGLSVDRAGRHPSMEALLAALDRGPRVRRRALVAAIAALVLVAGGAVLWAVASRTDPCGGARDRLAGVWDPAVKEAISSSFSASGRPGAAATFSRVSRVLDGQAAQWSSMVRESCEARRSGRQGVRATKLRSACLEERLAEMSELTRKLAEADGRMVDRAVHAVFELASVAACGDVQALQLGRPVDEAVPAVDPDACGVPPVGRYYPLEIGRVWVYDVIEKSTRRSRGDPKVVTIEALAPIGGCRGARRAYRMRQQSSAGWAFRWQEVVDVPSRPGRRPGIVTVRHRDQWFSADGTMTKDEYFVPSRIRLDETCQHTLDGATYLDAYDEVEVEPGIGCGEVLSRQTRTFDWKVVGVNVPVRLELGYENAACCPAGETCGPPPDGPGHHCTPAGDRRWSCEFQTLQVDRREVSGGTAATYWFAVGVGKVLEDEKGEDREVLMCFR